MALVDTSAFPLDTEIALAAAQACRVWPRSAKPGYNRHRSDAWIFSLLRRTVTACRSGDRSATAVGLGPNTRASGLRVGARMAAILISLPTALDAKTVAVSPKPNQTASIGTSSSPSVRIASGKDVQCSR